MRTCTPIYPTMAHVPHNYYFYGMSQKDLFPEFAPVTAQQWTDQLKKDLKEKDPKELTWHSPEGIDVEVFYTTAPVVALGDKKPGWQLLGSEADCGKATILSSDKTGLTESITNLLAQLDEQLAKGTAPNSIALKVSVGVDYFMEIARLRALRKLAAVLLDAYKLPKHLYILATNAAISDEHDAYYNMIRHTTQAMAAVIGGTDGLLLVAHHPTDGKAAFQQRIANNVSHILKEESKLDKVADPAAGSYYIDELTTQIAEKAWEGLVAMK